AEVTHEGPYLMRRAGRARSGKGRRKTASAAEGGARRLAPSVQFLAGPEEAGQVLFLPGERLAVPGVAGLGLAEGARGVHGASGGSGRGTLRTRCRFSFMKRRTSPSALRLVRRRLRETARTTPRGACRNMRWSRSSTAPPRRRNERSTERLSVRVR